MQYMGVDILPEWVLHTCLGTEVVPLGIHRSNKLVNVIKVDRKCKDGLGERCTLPMVKIEEPLEKIGDCVNKLNNAVVCKGRESSERSTFEDGPYVQLPLRRRIPMLQITAEPEPPAPCDPAEQHISNPFEVYTWSDISF